MLAYLTVKGESRRDELVSLFWADLPEEKARNAFRQTLHRLRKVLGDRLVAHQTTLSVLIGPDLTADIVTFESALQRGAFSEGLAQYRGPFLDGLELHERDFDNWVLGERARLEARYQWALEQAIAASSAAGDTAGALEKAALLSKSAPLTARAALAEASLLVAAGRTSEARSSLEQFVQRYRTEFMEEAPQEIRELLSRLRKDFSASASASVEAAQEVFVGRNAELSRLLAAWNDARGGRGNVILIEGPEGIGKSALVREFLSRIATLGPLLQLVGRERSSGSLLPYASIGQALRGVLNAPGLSGASQHLLAEAARLLPELQDQFDLPVLQSVEDEASQLRFYEGIAALIDAVAYEQPVCIVLEDFHSAAPSTTDMVEYLCGRLASVSVAVVIVFRSSAVMPAATDGFPFTLRDSAKSDNFSIPVTRIGVPALSASEGSALARSIADDDVLPDDECARITVLAGGVPYRIIDLARQAAGGLQISALPATLQESLWARLQGCSPAQQRLFVASALIERPASIKLLASASHLSESAAFDAVIVLEGRGLLQQTAQGVIPEHHEAAQLALKGTGPAGRALLAGWAAEALASEPNALHAELAHLFNLAGNARETFRHAIAAAHEAAAFGEERSALYFIELASQTAATSADRGKVDSLRRVLQPQARQLPSGEVPMVDESLVDADHLAIDGATSHGKPLRASVLFRSLLVTLARSTPVRIATAVTVGVGLALVGLSANQERTGVKGPVLPDTLFLVNRSAQTAALFYLSGEVSEGTAARSYGGKAAATWMDSLALPLLNPVMSPTGNAVAVERMRDNGPDILLFSADGKAFREIAAESGDDIIAGWSPDGNWLLATHGQTLPNGNYDADLFAISVDGNRRLPIDTSTSRAVVEAVWSPDGTHIAWTARVGDTHQQEVYVGNADGSNAVNVSNSSEEDYHIVWSPDGGRIAFTSNRFGNADIFAYELSTRKLWRLTGDQAQEDYAVFSPDGNFVAFESAVAGVSSVSVVRSWGGNPVRVAGGPQSFTLARWGNPPSMASYISKVRIVTETQVPIAGRVTAQVAATSPNNLELAPPAVNWLNLDPSHIALAPDTSDDTRTFSATLRGLKPGLARIGISAGGWRADTTIVRVGNSPVDLVSEDFTDGLDAKSWLSIGDSAPRVVSSSKGRVLSAKSGRQRESGVLSVARLPLHNGFFARITVRAPLSAPTAQRSFTISLVVPDSGATLNQGRLQNRLATIEWIGQAARVAYSVDRENWTEPVLALGAGDEHLFEIRIDQDGKVTFMVDGKERWKSRLQIARDAAPGRLWLGSQGAVDLVTFDDVRVGLNPVSMVR